MKFLSLVLGFLFLAATGAIAQTTNEIEGQKLVQDILRGTPTESVKQTGTLRIRGSKGMMTNTPIVFETTLETNNWITCYKATQTNDLPPCTIILVIFHLYGQTDMEYLFGKQDGSFNENSRAHKALDKTQIWAPFANSDFWIADLGLEFFHWPLQKVLRHESKKTRACTVLESTNPNPAPAAYSRVVTWIDNESHAIIYAEAYDVNNKLLKEFNPKKVKKVNGQWELEEMDIRNRQTGSRTWITFDLNGKS
jgi:hypothetical protein